MMEVTPSEDLEVKWNWESKDKCIRKKIICKGWWNGSRPTEGSACIIRIDTDGFEDFNIPVATRMPSTDQFKLIIGESDTEFKRMLDRLLGTMDTFEECFVEYLVNNIAYHVKIRLIQHGPGTPSYQLDPEKKFAKAIACKEQGVQLFNEGRVLDAYYRFKRAAQLLIFLDRNVVEYLPTYLLVCNNLAQCHLQLGNYEHVLSLCGKVLEKEPNNVKCLLRQAAALEKLRDFEKALDEYKKIIQIESNNQRALERLAFVKKEVDNMNARYTQAVKRMFNFK